MPIFLRYKNLPFLIGRLQAQNSIYVYFSNALELFATMSEIPREEARKVAKEFVSQVKPILKGAIDPSDLANWQKEKALICHKDYSS